jgi:hypothetical protein
MWGSGVENIENKNKREVDWESATGPRIHIKAGDNGVEAEGSAGQENLPWFPPVTPPLQLDFVLYFFCEIEPFYIKSLPR